MPVYVHATYLLAAVGLVAAVIAPAPRLPLARAAYACKALMLVGGVMLVAAVTLPAFDVWYPAFAAVGAALGFWLVMFWLARQPVYRDPVERAQDESDDDDSDDHGGGGGGPHGPDPEPDPPSPHGIDWDAFDQQRRAWERDRDRRPVSA